MENWITRNVKESGVIGGKQKKVYAVGPTATVEGSKPVSNPTSPWATSNVVAKVSGVTKTSNAVFPETRDGGGHCAKLCTQMESCKALGMINIDVMVAGTMFLGRMLEPIKSTSDPYSKMEMGVPFRKRPEALVFDYKLDVPAVNERIYSSGFSKKRTLKGRDKAEVIIILQKRWEDSDGNLHASRVGTGHELLGAATPWQNKHHLHVHYGDISRTAAFSPSVGLMNGKKAYYARNSKGKMVPVQEEEWASAEETPTHLIVMFSAGSGEPYVGTPGLTLHVDNVGLAYN